jgi:hypothetical protein
MPASRICSFGTKSLSTLDDCNVSQEFADVLTDEHSEAHGWGTFHARPNSAIASC